MKQHYGILVSILLFVLAGNTFSQDGQQTAPTEPQSQNTPAENPAANTGTPDEEKPSGENAASVPVVPQPPRIIVNPAVQSIVNEQFRWTPEDPSFLYETRNIPDRKNKEEFLPEELEKVVIRERIKEELDFRKSLDKIKIRLPGLTQTLVLVSIIIILLLYRSRVKKAQDQRR